MSGKGIGARLLAMLVTGLAGMALPAAAGEPPTVTLVHECPAASAVIISPTDADAVDVCRGAEAATTFFRSVDLKVGKAIAIEIVTEMPRPFSKSAAGGFLEGPRRVLVLSYEQFVANKTWLRLPIDRRMYRSVASHEVAHALAFDNFRVTGPTIEAKEYVAYVAMFATMSESQRRAVLDAFPGDGFDDEMKMSTAIYLMDPMRFGVEAYRHYLRQENGKSFLYAVLAGAALAE